MTLVAKCHCGATQIELPHFPQRRLQCNCTYCAKTGAIWGYFADGELTIVKDEHGRIYAPTGINQHHFCGQCGMQTWGSAPDYSQIYNNDGTPKEGHSAGDMPTRRTFAVNLNLLDDYDLASLTAEKIDGRNSW